MKFIRDIISEKRSLRPASMPMPSPTGTDIRFEIPALQRPLILSDRLPEAEAPVDIAAEANVSRGPDQALESEMNIFASDDGAMDHNASAQAATPHQSAPVEPARPLADEARPRFAMKGADETSAPMAPQPVAETHANDRSLSEMPFVSVHQADQPDAITPDGEMQVPPPAAGRGANRSGRVKTRLLGFNPESLGLSSPFEKAESRTQDTFPVGWLVVVAGPGRGAAFPLHDGVARIGRGDDQTVSLNFGDNSISRENHVSVAFDAEQNAFFIGQSGRSNIVRLNNKPLLSTEQVRSGDQIRVGETTLRLAALCGEGFSWATNH